MGQRGLVLFAVALLGVGPYERSGVTVPVSGSASVRVAATSANLGPGFDSLGLALALYDDVEAEVTAGGLEFDVSGEGASTVPRDETHLVIFALRVALDQMGRTAPGLMLRSTNRIPHGRGLGSSAAAICAGILLARALAAQSPKIDGGVNADADCAGNQALDDDDVLVLAAEIEGHPDNVAACLLGGATLAWIDDLSAARTGTGTDGPAGPARAIGLPLCPDITVVVFIPPVASSTRLARGLLPDQVSHRDAADNAARSALLVTALTTRPDLLLIATEDRLHQHYRAPAMPDSAALMTSLRNRGVAAAISGAGPTVLALVGTAEDRAQALACAPTGWRALPLAVDTTGALNDAPS